MRFQGLGSSSNYAQAGKSAADETVRAFAASRRNSTDFGKLTQKAANIRSAEKQAAIKAGAQVTQAGIEAQAYVKQNEIKLEGEQARDKGKRKAGALAAGGKLIAAAGQYGGEKRTKREVGSEDSYFDTRIEANKKSAADLRAQAENYGTGTDTSTPKTGTDGGLVATATPAPKLDGGITGNGSNGWARLSKVLRHGEGTSGDAGYTTQFTGTQFSDMSQHPRQIRSSNGHSSDAAGAYQFLSTTWDEAKGALNLPDFSKESQEKAGRFLTERRGVNPDQVFKTKEEFKGAMDKLAPEWASMPYSGQAPNGGGNGSSYYGQGGISLDQAWSLYNS